MKKISKEPTLRYLYAFEYPFNYELLAYCRTLKTKYGPKQFGFFEGKWRFNNLAFVTIIQVDQPDVVVMANMQEDMERYEIELAEKAMRTKKAEQLKAAKDTDFVVMNIKMPLYPYQKIGVEFFINNRGRAILADTMGLGKTAQALAYVAHTKKRKTLVVCPASVKYSWEDEAKKWTFLKPFVMNGQTELTAQMFGDYDIFIINYDILRKFSPLIKAFRFDCMICDEFHYIKNNSAQRTKEVKLIASTIQDVLLLSGTPLLSRPVELFNGLNIMDPVIWNDWFQYTVRYCTPLESPIWMGDYSFRPIGKIEVGDEIIGWSQGNGIRKSLIKETRDKLVRSTVLEIHEKEDDVYKITMESGNIIRCTLDHLWMSYWEKTGRPGRKKKYKWITPKIGSALTKVIDIPDDVPLEKKWLSGYLAGISDGEGTGRRLSQYKQANPVVWNMIGNALKELRIPYTAKEHGYIITGGRQGLVDFLNKVKPPKRNYKRLDIYTLGNKFKTKDKIEKIELDGRETVRGLTTTTGNYVVWGYASKNCAGHKGRFGWDYRGASHVEELQEKISRYFIRRTKDQVLPFLPKKIFTNRPVELDSEARALYDQADESFKEYLLEIKNKDTDQSEQMLQLAKMNELRQIAANGKTKIAKEFLTDLIEAGEKVVVFSTFVNPLKELKKHFGNQAVILTGETNELERRDIIQKFQNDKSVQIFLGGMKSAGVGITLTAATNVLFIDYSWVPADHMQATDRIHRIGQTAESVNIYQLFSRGTIDEYMKEVLEKKQKLFDKLIDGEGGKKIETQTSIMGDILREYKLNIMDKPKNLTSV